VKRLQAAGALILKHPNNQQLNANPTPDRPPPQHAHTHTHPTPQDFRRCEPMDEFFNLFGVNRVLRRGARLMRGMRIELKDDALSVTQLCALRWLSVTEEFGLAAGAAREHGRRDMRRGAQKGVMTRAADGVVRLEVSWGPPLEGCAVDEIRLVPTKQGRQKQQQQQQQHQLKQQLQQQQQQRGERLLISDSSSSTSGAQTGRSVSRSSGGSSSSSSSGIEAGDYELHVISSASVGGQKARFKWVCVKR